MKSNGPIHFVLVIASVALLTSDTLAAPFGTAFTYQGRLAAGTNAGNGLYDFKFSLWDAAGSGATPIGTTQTVSNVSISGNGLFAATLDFGAGAFNGGARWLELSVRTNGATSFGTLSPRQNLTPTPYAITASNLSGALPTTQLTGTLPTGLLSGTYSSAVTLNNSGNSFVGNGAGLTGVNASALGGYGYCALPCYWNLAGNSGTTAGVNFVGTTDNQPLELKVNSQRAFRLEPTTNSPNVIGGFAQNFATNIAVGVTIAGGGANNASNAVLIDSFGDPSVSVPHFAAIGGGSGNLIGNGSYGTIGGGARNDIEGNHVRPITYATIGGGASNFIGYVIGGTIAGGVANRISGDSVGGGITDYSTIGGGTGNQITDGGAYTGTSTIAGGAMNQISKAIGAAIGGGSYNNLGSEAHEATIAGGLGNTINGLCQYATISGGLSNHMDYSAVGATIGGGASNHVWFGPGLGNFSCATIPGGRSNSATNYAFASGCRAQAIHRGAFVWADNNEFDFASTNVNSFSVRSVGGARFVSSIDGSGNPNAGVVLKPGDGSWTSLSDRSSKENVAPVCGRQVLEQLATVPVATWNYKAQGKSIRHIGPMAQDFAAAFKVGEGDTGISTVDADGVALAAIQGLHEVLKEKDARIQSLEKDVAELKSLMNTLISKSDKGQQ